MLNLISMFGETTCRPDQVWSNGREFSSYSNFPVLGQLHDIRPKFWNEVPENACSISFHTQNLRNFWLNGKCPRYPFKSSEVSEDFTLAVATCSLQSALLNLGLDF